MGSGFKNTKRSFIYDFVRPLMGNGLGFREGEFISLFKAVVLMTLAYHDLARKKNIYIY